MMADGLLGKCKECTKADVSKHRENNHEKVCAYDRKRSKEPIRKQLAAVYQQAHRAKHPEHNRARGRVAYAVRNGLIVKQPCRCGSTKVQAHNHDYSKPLDVEWLCFKCHREDEHGHKVESEA